MAVLIFILIMLFVSVESQADIYKYISDDGTVYFTNAPIEENGTVVVKEKRSYQRPNKEYNKGYVHRENFHNMAEERAKRHNIDPQLVKAVIKAESNWNPNAVSPKGAQGLMQLMPSTASIMGVSNPFNPEANIDGGIRYLKYLLQKFNGNLTLALAAYNAGPKLVEKIKSVPPIPETITYVKRVINYYSGGRGTANTDFAAIRREDRIQRMILKDGTVLFTNSYLANAYGEQGF